MRWQLVELSAAAAGAPGATLPVEAKAPVSRLFSNSAAMAAANIAGRGLGYAYIVMLARRLDARYLGAYALLLTASMLIELVSNLGLDKILVREISAGSASVGQGYFWAALPIRLVMAAVISTPWRLHGAWGYLANDFELAPAFAMQTGLPYSVGISGASSTLTVTPGSAVEKIVNTGSFNGSGGANRVPITDRNAYQQPET